MHVEMKLTAIIGLLASIHFRPMRSYQLEYSDCPSIQVASKIRDVNRDFFHLKAWYIYAHTDPHPNYLSMFHMPKGISPSPQCLRLLSEKQRGLLVIRYIFPSHTELYRVTLYNEDTSAETYQQVHNHKNLYKLYRRFTSVQVLVTDGDTYVVFYGCQKVRNKALIGLMFLVRTDVYDHFTPPPGLMELLWLKLSFNVTQNLPQTEQECDYKGALQDTYRKIMEGYLRDKAKQELRERIEQQFAIGIRNFFICVFSFMLWLLGMNKLIDKYVFGLKY
uniref:Uncharacterized protein n=1 Tax=Anopheles culicifacies TaxID=139723 RepID=A0A182LZE8_9DIPT